VPRVTYSTHARERMVLRGVSRREAEEAIRRGKKRRQGGQIVATLHYFEVVYVVREDTIRVVTVQPRW
jgi:hypothetical protein